MRKKILNLICFILLMGGAIIAFYGNWLLGKHEEVKNANAYFLAAAGIYAIAITILVYVNYKRVNIS